MATQIQLRRDSAADWTSNDPTLAAGEIGLETDTGRFKIGNGSTAWTSLNYFSDVPDASADGEALAYDQDGAQLGGLVIADTQPNIDWQDTAPADERIFRIRVNGGFTYFRVVNDDDSTRYEPFKVEHGTGDVDMTGATSVDVPAISGTSQAAQVTAYDATTGRLAIGGHEIGDTGWREITSWDSGGVVTGTPLGSGAAPTPGTSGSVQIRRVGNLVHYLVTGVTFTGPQCFTNPTNFFPDLNPAYPVAGGAVSTANTLFTMSCRSTASRWDQYGGNGAHTRLAWSYPCTQAWPSSLPGTAA